MAPANMLGIPKLPERGYNLADVQRVAAALRCAVQSEPDGFQIVGAFGYARLRSLADVAACLNARSFRLEA